MTIGRTLHGLGFAFALGSIVCAQVTQRVSVDSSEVQGNLGSHHLSISADGRFVAFTSDATNLVPGDTNGWPDVFIRDSLSGTAPRVSVDSSGMQRNGTSREPSMSADGRYVAFTSSATSLVPVDTNGFADTFVHDRLSGTTGRVSLSSGAAQGNADTTYSLISADGRFVALESVARNLVPGDTNGERDIFLHDRGATGFTSLCEPGVGGVRTCACSNPPSGAGRGCNNSAATGGAFLTASGIAYLSMDTRVLASLAEKPSALSIVLQGHALVSSGLV